MKLFEKQNMIKKKYMDNCYLKKYMNNCYLVYLESNNNILKKIYR